MRNDKRAMRVRDNLCHFKISRPPALVDPRAFLPSMPMPLKLTTPKKVSIFLLLLGFRNEDRIQEIEIPRSFSSIQWPIRFRSLSATTTTTTTAVANPTFSFFGMECVVFPLLFLLILPPLARASDDTLLSPKGVNYEGNEALSFRFSNMR